MHKNRNEIKYEVRLLFNLLKLMLLIIVTSIVIVTLFLKNQISGNFMLITLVLALFFMVLINRKVDKIIIPLKIKKMIQTHKDK